MSRLVHLHDLDGIARITLDDGGLNLFDTGGFRALQTALTDSTDADGVLLAGRPGVLTAGLDLKALQGLDRHGFTDLLVAFGEAMMALWTHPGPVVLSATGHAIATGTMLSMAADHSVAAEGEHNWGLTETAIGLVLPCFGIALARHNIAADQLDDLLLPGRKVSPEEAARVGFADEVAAADAVEERASQHLAALTNLDRGVYAEQKRRLRGVAAAQVRAGLAEDARALAVRATS